MKIINYLYEKKQKIINTFLLCFLFYLLFLNIVFNIFPLPGFFSYWDEGVTLLSIGYILYRVIIKKDIILSSLDTKNIKILLVVVCIGAIGNIFFGYVSSFDGIFRDVVNFLKFPILFILIKYTKLDEALSNILYDKGFDILKIIINVIFSLGIISLFFNLGLSQNEIRFGFMPYQFLFSHPTFLVLFCACMLAILNSINVKGSVFLYEFMVSLTVILTMRTKGIVFIVLYFFVKYLGKWLEKYKAIYVCTLILVAFIVAYDKIALYNSFSTSPREVMYFGSLSLILKCFPFGSGFSSFASHISWKYNSKIYEFIQIPFYYENGVLQTAVLGDAGYPYYIAQFGIFGILLLFIVIYSFFKESLRNCKRNLGIITIFLYIVIALSSESILLNNGVELAFISAICIYLSENDDKVYDESKKKKYVNNIFMRGENSFMKIGLELCDFSKDHLGGKDEVAYNLLRGFSKLGYSNDVVCFCHSDLIDIIHTIDENISVCVVPKINFKGPFRPVARIIEGIYIKNKLYKYSVGGLLFTNKLAPIIRFPIKTAVISHDIQIFDIHNIPGMKSTKYFEWSSKHLIQMDFKLRNYIIAISDFDKQNIIKYMPWAVNKVKRIYNPIVFNDIYVSKEKKYITALNIQWEHKNVKTLIKAFALIHNCLEYDLMLVGKKPANSEELMEFIKKNNLTERIHFTGFVSNVELTDIISKTAIYINPSLYEGFGMTAIEMMGNKVPTIVAENTAMPEVTLGLCRYYSPGTDEKALAKEILNEINEPHSDVYLADIAKKIRDKYSYIEIAQLYWKFLQSMIMED